jgi:hypothetical protein
MLLADIEPHMALSLLANSSRAMLGFYWSLTPSDLCKQAETTYDDTIGLAIKCLLCPKGTSAPRFSQACFDRAVDLLRLPFFHSGADLVRSADDGPCVDTAKFIALTGSRSSYLHGKRNLFSTQITAAHAIVVEGIAQERASKLELTIKSMERATDPEERSGARHLVARAIVWC